MIDPAEIASLRRLMDSIAAKAGRDDPGAVVQLQRLAMDMQRHVTEAGRAVVSQPRGNLHGGGYAYSYGDLARELGVTPQAARKRFSRD